MNNISLLSTAYFPPISWFALFLKADEVLIEAHEHYIKQTYRNRAEIYGANGLLPLIIPVDHRELASLPIKDVKISHEQPWKKIHLRSIESAYRNSPFFEYYEDELKAFYETDYERLFELNNDLLQAVLGMLGIKKEISFTEFYSKEHEGSMDYRNTIVPEKKMLNSAIQNVEYHQVFGDRNGFIPDLSIIDLLFNEGPKTLDYLNRLISLT